MSNDESIKESEDVYDPNIELLDMAITYNQTLAVEIMKRLKDEENLQLPVHILDKIVAATKRDKLSFDFYDHM